MALTTPVDPGLSANRGFLGRPHAFLSIVAERLAFIGVAGMLIAAGATVIDVTLQSTLRAGVVALNEITSMAVAIAIAACIPAGVIGGVNLKIDVFSRWINGRLAAWLDAVGAAALLLFFGLLTQHIALHSVVLYEEARTSVLLGWPLAPFMFVVVVLLGIGTVIQALITLQTVKAAWSYVNRDVKTYPVVTFIAVVLGIFILGLIAYGIADFQSMSGWAQRNPATAVSISLLVMWILMLGLVPLAALSGLVGIVGCALFIGFAPALKVFATEATGLLTNSQIATLPLFLMMGSFAAVSGMADDLYKLAHVLFSRYRGGLAMATIGSSAGFGALTGSSIATAAVIGRVAIPEMRRNGFSPALATGVCAAGGTLGPLVPPGSTPLIIFAILTESSVGQLFMASVGPAILAVLLYFITIYIYVRVAPKSAPPAIGGIDILELRSSLRRCIPVALLVFGVMGGIFFGFFTDTQSAAVGAIGAFICAVARGKLNKKTFFEVMVETTATTAMVYGLIMGAQVFSYSISLSALADSLVASLGTLQLSPATLMTLIVVGYLMAGMILESMAIMIITVPVITPLIESMGYDIIWWGIVMLCIVETGMIHPPFGLNVIVLKAITPDVSLWTIYKGVTPFVAADLLKLVVLIAFPAIALWLPRAMVH